MYMAYVTFSFEILDNARNASTLEWGNTKNNRRTIGLLSLDNWRGVNLWRNKNELPTLETHLAFPAPIMLKFR